MKFSYISPSELPSRAANSVHVVMQCDALNQVDGVELNLYAKRTVENRKQLPDAMREIYGADLIGVRMITYAGGFRAVSLRITMLALWDMFRGEWPDVLLSRNLYASYLIGVLLRRPIFFETHQLEFGFRKVMQRQIMLRSNIITIVISRKLEEYLTQHHGLPPSRTLVLHDAAPAGSEPLRKDMRREVLMKICPEINADWSGICGYFGHLYAGRGVEIIEAMAEARPRVLFLLFGGNEVDLQYRRKNKHCENLCYIGYVPHHVAQQAMKSVDILLMPYQKSVAIGSAGHDTARWMSPMKMFEYMASGVPIISSDLPVLAEILRDGENALLVPPDDPGLWVSAIDRLLSDYQFSSAIGDCAYDDYKKNHTWTQRAQRLIEAAKTL